jgi:hypothetical protein
MKTIRLITVLFIAAVMTGCATTGHEDTTTGAVAGGLLGGGITKAAGGSATKGAVAGALIGAGIGVLSDAKDRKDAVREEKINQMITTQTQGVGVAGAGNAQVAGAVAETQKNVAFAKGERDKCQTKFAIYKQAGIKKPYNCEEVFNDALRRAEDASAIADPLLYNAAVYDGIRPGSRHAGYWQRSRMDPYYRTRW